MLRGDVDCAAPSRDAAHMLLALAVAATVAAADPAKSTIEPVPFTSVKITDGC